MSKWFKIDDEHLVHYAGHNDTINVLYDHDDCGNNYLVIPMAFIKEALRDEGYKVKIDKNNDE